MRRAIVIALSIIFSTLVQYTHALELPVIETFRGSPTEVELTSPNTRVDIELVVSHSSGIENSTIIATLRNGKNDSLNAVLTRSDNPVNQTLKRVVFKGFVDFPRDINTGAFVLSAAEVKSNYLNGQQTSSGPILGEKIRELSGAESGILVRNNGNLNLDIPTFIGPSYDVTLGLAYSNPIKYNFRNQPIWRVGESFNPSDYFEMQVKNISLQVTSSTPSVCSSDGKIMIFKSIGNCAFEISTPRTADYLARKLTFNQSISEERTKINLVIDSISNQTSKDLPKEVKLSQVLSPSNRYVLPVSETPQICLAAGFYVKLLKGGTCTLSYKALGTSEFKESDVYYQTFEILRDAQSLDFNLPTSATLNEKSLTLSANASSAEPVTFRTSDNTVCTVETDKLNFLKAGNCEVTAAQAGTATQSPVSKTLSIQIIASDSKKARTMLCVKGAKKTKVKAVKPKCPKGYVKAK